MLHDTFEKLPGLSEQSAREMLVRRTGLVLWIIFVSSMLAGCGTATAAVKATPVPTSVRVIAPTPVSTFTPVPTPSPTREPTPTPVPPAPSTPVPAAPALLDLQPASMSIVGHLDCRKNGAFICIARVLSRASNASNLSWTAFTNVPGNIVFSPASGVLAPGQSVQVTITVPLSACTPGLFFFRGPANTHTITWAC